VLTVELTAQLICANDTDNVHLYRVVINELRLSIRSVAEVNDPAINFVLT